MVGCPLCTKTGLVLIIIGFSILFLGSMQIFPTDFTMWLGLGVIISAYIVPNFMKTKTCADGSCNIEPSQNKK